MSYIVYRNQGATRNKPLNNDLVKRLSFLPEMGVTMEVFSGGQPGKDEGGPRVGSVRHDHGGAADAFFYKDGRKLDWSNPDDQPIFKEIVSRAKANGVTGFGAGDGYMQPGSMHIGMGTPGVWGAKGKGANAPEWLRSAFGASSEPVAAQAQANVQAAPTIAKDDRGFGQRVFDRFLGTETPEQAKASLLPKILPEEFMGVNTAKAGKLLSGAGTAFNAAAQANVDAMNKQVQAAAQAGQARRTQGQPVQLAAMSSMGGAQGEVPGTISSLPNVASAAQITPEDLMKLLEEQKKMKVLGGWKA